MSSRELHLATGSSVTRLTTLRDHAIDEASASIANVTAHNRLIRRSAAAMPDSDPSRSRLLRECDHLDEMAIRWKACLGQLT